MTRRQRRAAEAKSSQQSDLQSAADIPLSHPPSSKPIGKTLYEIAAERQAQLASQGQSWPNPHDAADVEHLTISSNGKLQRSDLPSRTAHDRDGSVAIDPLFDTLFLALPLSFLHFTLSFLTVHQYAQEMEIRPIIWNTIFVAFPTLALMIHLFHGHLLVVPVASRTTRARKYSKMAQQTLFLITANVMGCYLIQLTNDRGYYAVMKKAPGIGTIWVWSVLELGLVGAVAGVAGPGLYAWWNGYGVW